MAFKALKLAPRDNYGKHVCHKLASHRTVIIIPVDSTLSGHLVGKISLLQLKATKNYRILKNVLVTLKMDRV